MQISAAQRDKVLGYIEGAKKEGAKIATGGKPWAESKGFYVEPTIIQDVNSDMTCVKEEVSRAGAWQGRGTLPFHFH